MMQFRFWIATAALCLAAQSAAAQGTSAADCRAVSENGSNRMICNNTFSLGIPQNRTPSREEVTYSVAPSAPAATRTDNFCGDGYRMTSDGCQAAPRGIAR